jgi:hypothetical protein
MRDMVTTMRKLHDLPNPERGCGLSYGRSMSDWQRTPTPNNSFEGMAWFSLDRTRTEKPDDATSQ